jgi:acyl-coenzyme A thioesterase PaaI-like protein
MLFVMPTLRVVTVGHALRNLPDLPKKSVYRKKPVRRLSMFHACFSRAAKIARISTAIHTAACVLLDLPEDRARVPWPWLSEGFMPSPQNSWTFDSNELKALESCELAEAAATDAHPFIEHFWCGIPEAGEGKADLQVRVTPHVGNRIGYVQGGLLLGTAVKVANAAAPKDMRLSNVSAYFVSPGVGPVLDIHSDVTHRGRSLAVVRSKVIGWSGKLVLETTSQHVLT